MKCPSCGENTPDSWRVLLVEAGFRSDHTYSLRAPGLLGHDTSVAFDWMHCANETCKQLVVRMHESIPTLPPHIGPETQTRYVRPMWSIRRIDSLVPEPFRTDYLDAAAILGISPRMSAVLTRKIVYDLLERYADVCEYTLKASLDKFIVDVSHPTRVRESLQHLREIGDFGAHTQKDGVGKVIDVSSEDAEWTMDLVDRLFDYFILDPERDKALRSKWDTNLQDTGRKPIKPVPPSDGVS